MKEELIIKVDRKDGNVDFENPGDPHVLLYAMIGLTYAAAQTFGEKRVRTLLEHTLKNEYGGEPAIEEEP